MPVSAVTSVNYSRLRALRDRHEALSRQIEEAQRTPSTRDFLISQLKKQKLLVKEKLESFKIAMNER